MELFYSTYTCADAERNGHNKNDRISFHFNIGVAAHNDNFNKYMSNFFVNGGATLQRIFILFLAVNSMHIISCWYK